MGYFLEKLPKFCAFFGIKENWFSNCQSVENSNGFQKCHNNNIAIFQEDSDFALNRKILKIEHILGEFTIDSIQRHPRAKQFFDAAFGPQKKWDTLPFQTVFKGLSGKKTTFRINGKTLKTTSVPDWKSWHIFVIGTDPVCGPKNTVFLRYAQINFLRQISSIILKFRFASGWRKSFLGPATLKVLRIPASDLQPKIPNL